MSNVSTQWSLFQACMHNYVYRVWVCLCVCVCVSVCSLWVLGNSTSFHHPRFYTKMEWFEKETLITFLLVTRETTPFMLQYSSNKGITQTRSAREMNTSRSRSTAWKPSFNHMRVLVRTREGPCSNTWGSSFERVRVLIRTHESPHSNPWTSSFEHVLLATSFEHVSLASAFVSTFSFKRVLQTEGTCVDNHSDSASNRSSFVKYGFATVYGRHANKFHS